MRIHLYGIILVSAVHSIVYIRLNENASEAIGGSFLQNLHRIYNKAMDLRPAAPVNRSFSEGLQPMVKEDQIYNCVVAPAQLVSGPFQFSDFLSHEELTDR